VDAVAGKSIVAPVEEELARLRSFRQALREAERQGNA
jgi:hypothetical protein